MNYYLKILVCRISMMHKSLLLLICIFSRTFGELKFVRLPKKLVGTGPHRGFGFVEFLSKHDAKVSLMVNLEIFFHFFLLQVFYFNNFTFVHFRNTLSPSSATSLNNVYLYSTTLYILNVYIEESCSIKLMKREREREGEGIT